MNNRITQATRLESLNEIKSSIPTRQEECLSSLRKMGTGTASELAYDLYALGFTDSFQRNYTHPRLNELVKDGVVEIIGKEKCKFTGRKVAVYRATSA